jgi:Holliday junction resolvasome RuvABC endonuclease subunit
MLVMPESKEPFRIAGFDPGANLGLSLIENHLDGSKPIVKIAETAKLNPAEFCYKDMAELHGNRVARLMILYDRVTEFLRTHKPHGVIIEGNYLGRFANAFSSLVECVFVIRNAVYAYDPFLPLQMVDPTTVKTNIGMKKIRGTDKEDVRKALASVKDLEWDGVDINDLDEHAVDSVAIGYYYTSQLL